MQAIFRGNACPGKSSVKYCLILFGRWLLTVVTCVVLALVLKMYSKETKIMSEGVKRIFNSIVLGLTILLSLALTSVLERVIRDVRWWFLSRRYRPRKTVELMLQADGIVSAVILALGSRRFSLYIIALVWFLIALLSQVGLTCIPLTFSVEAAKKLALIKDRGLVAIPDMSSIESRRTVLSNYSSVGSKEYTANIYGSMSLTYGTANLSAIPDTGRLWIADNPLIFCGGNETCVYSFQEQSPNEVKTREDDFQPIIVASNRTITTTSSCKSHRVLSGGNGTTTFVTYSTADGTKSANLPRAEGLNQTTFMTDVLENCGPGCGKVQAFEASLTDPWFYECNVTVGAVLNATRPEHEIGSELRELAARGIALQGFAISSSMQDVSVQYQSYPAESTFGTAMSGHAKKMALLTSRFATGVITTTSEANSNIIVPGYPPLRGSKLTIENVAFLVLILLVAIMFQTVLSLIAGFIACRIIVPADGLVGIARVLKSMTAESITTEKLGLEVADAKCPSDCQDCEWIYRHTYISELGVYDLYMEKRPCGWKI